MRRKLNLLEATAVFALVRANSTVSPGFIPRGGSLVYRAPRPASPNVLTHARVARASSRSREASARVAVAVAGAAE